MLMKLSALLHRTAELHADAVSEDAEQILTGALGTQFTGKAAENVWMLSRIDRNPFRPAIQLRFVPEEDGTLLWLDYRADRMLLLFMLVWSLVVIGIAVWKGWLMLVMLPVFWVFVLVGFSSGIKKANQDLIDLFGAYEIMD